MKKLTYFTLAFLFTVLLISCKGKQSKPTDLDSSDSTEFVDGQDWVDDDLNMPVEVELKVNEPQPIDIIEFRDNLTEKSLDFSRIQQRLINDLLALDNSSPKALIESKDVLKKYFKNVTAKQADSLYFAYQAYASTMLGYIYNDEYYVQVPAGYYETYDSFHMLPPVYQPIMDELNSYGIQLEDIGEGCADLSFYPNYFYELFKSYTTEATREYLRLMAFEYANPFLFDAAVCISWEELADRVVNFEEYLDKYSNSMFTDDIKDLHNSYVILLLIGCDNTGTLDRSKTTYKLYPDVRTAYQNIINTYPNRRVTDILKEYLNLLDDNNLNEEELEEFLTPYRQDYYYEYD